MNRTLHFQNNQTRIDDAALRPPARRRRLGFASTLGCLVALAGCAGSQANEAPAATAVSEPNARESNRGDTTRESAVRPHEETLRSPDVAGEAIRPQPASEPIAHADDSTKRVAEAHQTTPPVASGAADNTARNKRERDDRAQTPLDQGNNTSDINITASIRKALMDESSLSFDAKNVKIITNGGEVVLRGPVKSAAEKTLIESHAQRAAGAGHVTSHLEIAK